MAKYPKYYVRPDGLHETIIRINGKRKAFRGKTDREVWEKVKAFDRAAAEAEAEEETTFETVADKWWEEIEPTLAPSSLKSYKPALARAKKEFGAHQIGTITAQEIDRFIKGISAQYAKKTTAMQLQVIRQSIRWAEINGYVQYNPAASVRQPLSLIHI